MSISNRKVVIVGAGHVGSHVGYALISQSLADEIVYIDSDRAKAVAQALDLTDATNYLPVRTKVTAGDYSDAKDAQIMIICGGPAADRRSNPHGYAGSDHRHPERCNKIHQRIRF